MSRPIFAALFTKTFGVDVVQQSHVTTQPAVSGRFGCFLVVRSVA